MARPAQCRKTLQLADGLRPRGCGIALALTHFASSEHIPDMTHNHSRPVFPVVRRLLRRACPLVSWLVLAACSANDSDPDARRSDPNSGPTESINASGGESSPRASARVSSPLDCSSASPPKADFQTFIATCRARAANARDRAESTRSHATNDAIDVYASRTTVAELDFADVPTWSDADILAQFASARDDRYLTQTFPPEPSFQRRMSWLFPDDGCFARAEQVDVRVAQFGKSRPHKLFAFGRERLLRVYTDNAPGGVVEWWYHVVPVVKNSVGEPIVFDPAVSPCKPLPYRQWLALMTDDMASYDDVADGNGVALGDSWSYDPYSLPSGESPHSAESLDTLQGIYLSAEWSRQTELGRDPNLVLGTKPPWSGDRCLSAEVETQTATVAPEPARR